MSTTGLIYDIQGYSVHDGPGIRTTVFLKGCPLSCPWCHSPESQSFDLQVCFKKTGCMGLDACTHCIDACPNSAIGDEGDAEGGKRLPSRARKLCNDCGACVKACPPKAFYICGKEWTVEDVIARVLRDKPFYESSGGGVTLSGGEALSQVDFAEEFLRTCKEAGLNTALDTTGYAPRTALERVAPYVDLYLYDLKHMDSARHKQACGVPNEPILDNARYIAGNGGKLQVRVPLIPLFNDSEENMRATAAFCKELGDAVETVQLLPYHTLGISKYERLQYDEKVFAAEPVSDTRAEALAVYFKDEDLPVVIH